MKKLLRKIKWDDKAQTMLLRLVLNTPHLRELRDELTDVGFMDEPMLKSLERLIYRAERYLAGHREQGSLDLEPAA